MFKNIVNKSAFNLLKDRYKNGWPTYEEDINRVINIF